MKRCGIVALWLLLVALCASAILHWPSIWNGEIAHNGTDRPVVQAWHPFVVRDDLDGYTITCVSSVGGIVLEPIFSPSSRGPIGNTL